MTETFYRALFKETLHDLQGGPSDWFGIVANPTSADVVPLVHSSAFGLVPSLTYARMTIDANVCAHYVYEYEQEHPGERGSHRSDDTYDFAEVVIRAVEGAPPRTSAALAVAMQVLGVQVGREWTSQGYGAGALLAAWTDDAQASDPVLDWVAERWGREPAPDDDALDPARLLDPDPRRIARNLSLLESALHRVAVAAFDTHRYRFDCLVDPTVTATENEPDPGRFLDVAGPPATWDPRAEHRHGDEPPF